MIIYACFGLCIIILTLIIAAQRVDIRDLREGLAATRTVVSDIWQKHLSDCAELARQLRDIKGELTTYTSIDLPLQAKRYLELRDAVNHIHGALSLRIYDLNQEVMRMAKCKPKKKKKAK